MGVALSPYYKRGGVVSDNTSAGRHLTHHVMVQQKGLLGLVCAAPMFLNRVLIDSSALFGAFIDLLVVIEEFPELVSILICTNMLESDHKARATPGAG